MSSRSLIAAVKTRGILPLAASAATVAGYIALSPLNDKLMSPALFLCKVAVIINVIALLAWLPRRDAPLSLFVAGGWLAATVFYIGLGPMAGVLLIALASLAVGSALLGAGGISAGVMLACGLAVLTSIISWSLPFPIHNNGLYFVLASLLVAWQHRPIRALLTGGAQQLHAGASSMPWVSLLTINIVGIAATPLWLPTMQSDDIAYHLALPTQLQALGYYRMAIDESIWALAPWASDVIHGIAQVLAQAESRGAVNLLWMGVLYTASWQLGRQLTLPSPLLAGVIALYASLPLSSAMLAGMQTELPASALMVVLLALINQPQRLQGRQLCAIALVAGLMLATKLSNAFMLLPAAVWLLARHYRDVPYRALPVAITLGALAALPSYTYGLLIAENPTLPFLNGYFQSPYALPINWSDGAWIRPITPLLPWQLSFNTSNYLSAPDGAGGFLYPLIFIGLFPALYYRSTRALALVGIAAFMLVFSQIQYVRYTHPALMPLLLASIAGLAKMGSPLKTIALAIAPLVVLNMSMISSGYWHLAHGALHSLVRKGEDATLERYAPQRTIAQFLRDLDTPPGSVLFHLVDSQGNAELVMPTSTTSWYNPWLAQKASSASDDPTGESWKQLLLDHGTTHLVIDRKKIPPALEKAITGGNSNIIHKQGIYDIWQLDLRQQLTHDVLHDGKDYLKLAYRMELDGIGVNIKAQFQCSLPGSPIVISVSSRAEGSSADTNHRSGWAMCGKDNKAAGQLDVVLPEGPRHMRFTAVPRDSMDFSLISISTETTPSIGDGNVDPATQLRQKLSTNSSQDDSK